MDQSLIVAEKYKNQPQLLEQALLGGQNTVTDPYTALNALQKLKQSNMMQTAQAAQQAPAAQAQPSIKDSTVAAVNQNRMVAPGIDGDLEHYYGTGGIVAFAMGGVPVKGYKGNKGSVTSSSDSNDADTEEANYQQSAPAGYADPIESDDGTSGMGGNPNAMDPYIQQIVGQKPSTMTTSEFADAVNNAYTQMQKFGGDDGTKKLLERLDAQDVGMKKDLDVGQGVALLKASQAVAQGNNLVRGLANAAAEGGGAYQEVLKNQQAEQQHRDMMRFHLADAQRKDKLGMYKDAVASVAQARQSAQAADTFRLNQVKALAELQKYKSQLAHGAGAGSFDVNALNAKTEAYVKAGMDPVKAKEKAANDILASKQQKNVFSVSDISGNKADIAELEENRKITADERKALNQALINPANADYYGLSREQQLARENKIIADIRSQSRNAKPDAKSTTTPTTSGNYNHLWE